MPKPRVPPYPRPVPFIEPEEAPVLSDTIVYERWTNEVEQEAAKRASKRRKRIQDCAYAYLRDEPVVILSAGLKGPFGKGWSNPWQRKQQDGVQIRVMDSAWEVPETTARPVGAPNGVHDRQRRWRGGLEDQYDTPSDVDRERMLLKQKELEPSVNVPKARSRSPTTIGGQSPTSVKRVEDWLKRNEVYTDRLNRDADTSHLQSSPTPRTRPGLASGQPSNHNRCAPSHCEVGHGKQNSERKSEPPVSFAQSAIDVQSSAPTHDSPGRAEAAIIEHKRRSVHKVPPSTNLDAFEYRRGRQQNREDSEHHENQIKPVSEHVANVLVAEKAKARALQQEPIAEPTPDETSSQAKKKGQSNSKPVTSKETSKAATTNDLPSAQPIPAPMEETNAQSTEGELEVLYPPIREKCRRALSTRLVRASLTEVATQEQTSDAAKDDPIAVDTHPSVAEQTPAREFETQEMIAAMKPFEISTVKKPLLSTIQRATPVTATKVSAKRKKQASFANDPASSSLESQGSLKKSMKVTKGCTGPTPSQEKAKASVVIYEEVDQGKNNGAGLEPLAPVDSLPSLSSMFGVKNKSAPRSILKASIAASSALTPAGTGNTNSTSIKQDAQVPEAGQNMDFTLADEDNFDLDEAIDELGSYLGGTWEA